MCEITGIEWWEHCWPEFNTCQYFNQDIAAVKYSSVIHSLFFYNFQMLNVAEYKSVHYSIFIHLHLNLIDFRLRRWLQLKCIQVY